MSVLLDQLLTEAPITQAEKSVFEPACLMTWQEMCAGMDDMADSVNPGEEGAA